MNYEMLMITYIIAGYMLIGFLIILVCAFIIELVRLFFFGVSSLPKRVERALINIFRGINMPYYDIKRGGFYREYRNNQNSGKVCCRTWGR